jgi:hypothetical protein
MKFDRNITGELERIAKTLACIASDASRTMNELQEEQKEIEGPKLFKIRYKYYKLWVNGMETPIPITNEHRLEPIIRCFIHEGLEVKVLEVEEEKEVDRDQLSKMERDGIWFQEIGGHTIKFTRYNESVDRPASQEVASMGLMGGIR